MQLVKPVVVQINALSKGPGDGSGAQGPYEQWNADLARCGGCGAECVTRFAREPFWRSESGEDRRHQQPYVVVEERRGGA
jgi:hypothetical protein